MQFPRKHLKRPASVTARCCDFLQTALRCLLPARAAGEQLGGQSAQAAQNSRCSTRRCVAHTG
jgi:hypothetical protein